MNKLSKYNYFHQNGENVILFNYRTNSYMVLLPRLAQIISENKDKIDNLIEIHPELYSVLKSQGFIVDKNFDEVDAVLESWQKTESSTSSYSITILPTLDCNCRCWYCYEQHKVGTTMSDDIVERIKKHIDFKLSQTNIKYFNLSFFGGEPFMCFNNVVVPLLNYAKKVTREKEIKFYVHFTTNAVLLSEKMIYFLKGLEVDVSFQITLDGNRKQHDSIRCTKNGKPTYDIIVNNIHKLLRNEFKVTLRVNYTALNIDVNYDIIDEFKDLSCSERKLLNVEFQQVWQDSVSRSNKSIAKLKNVKQCFKKNGLCSLSTINKSFRCYADCENKIVINYNGDIYKCTARDFLTNNREGILKENGDIEFNKLYNKRMCNRHTQKVCLACEIFPICYGTCSQYNIENGNNTECPYCYTAENKNKLIVEQLRARIDIEKNY